MIAGVLVLGVASGVAFGVPGSRRSLVPPVRHAVVTMWTVLRSP